MKRSCAEPIAGSRVVWLAISAVTLMYLYLMINQPKVFRYAMVALPLATVAFFLIRDVRTWMLALPVLITFGGGEIEYGEFFSAPVTIGVVISAFVYLVYRLSRFEKVPDFPLPFKVVFLAYLAQLASIFATFYLHDNYTWNVLREGHKLFLSALLLPMVYYWYGSGIWLERFLKVMVLMLVVMSIVGIYQYTSGNIESIGELASGFDLAGRVYSTVSGGPNSYSGVLELLVPTALASMFFFRSALWKKIAFAAVILGILNVLYTFSRGGFLTVTGSSLLFLVYRYRTRVWVPMTALLLFAGFIVANANEFERQLTLFGNPRSLMTDVSLLHRYTSYKGFLSEMSRDITTGTGWGGSEYFYGGTSLYGFWEVRHEDSIEKIDRFGGLNSLVLEMPLKGGFFSIVSLGLLVTAGLLVLIRLVKSGAGGFLGMGMFFGMLGFSAHQLFDNLIPWPQTGAFFWTLFALMAAQAFPCCSSRED